MGKSNPRGPKVKAPRPTPLRGRPERPSGLDTEAANHWDAILDLMDRAGTLSLLDGDSLRTYIDAWMRYRKAKVKMGIAGLVVDGLHGPKLSPWYRIMMDAARDMRQHADRFGLTPQSRSRLKIEPDDKAGEGKWAGFGVVRTEAE